MENDRKLLTSKLSECINAFKRSNMHRMIHSNMEIKPSELHLLFHLYKWQTEAGVKTSSISDKMNIAPPSITPLINSLESKGLIERIRNNTDRRVILVHTTEKGESVVKEFEKSIENFLGEIVDFLGDNDANELIRILTKTNVYLTGKRGKS